MPKVTVIIPVYNAEKFLEECLNSIINQTLSDIEIIIVNDGSTDSSAEICKKYTEKDNRIKYIEKDNSGKGETCNVAMDIATGEYLSFIDADDYIKRDMMEALYKKANEYDADIVKAEWYRNSYKINSMVLDKQLNEFPQNRIITLKEYPDLLIVQPTLWSGIYKTEFINRNNIRYLETPGAFQDVAFTHKVFYFAQSIVLLPEPYVYYRIDNDTSSVHSGSNSAIIFYEYEEIDRILALNPEIKKVVNTSKLKRQFFDYEWNYHRIRPTLRSDFRKRVMKEFKQYKENNELTLDFYSYVSTFFLSQFI